MAVRGLLTEIPPDIFDRVADGISAKELIAASLENYSIDVAWHEFHETFRLQGYPLSLAIAGNCLHPESPHTLEEFFAGGHNHYIGFASPTLVRETDKALSVVSKSQLEEWVKQVWPDNTPNTGVMFLDELKAAYSQVATRGNAMEIAIQ